MKKGCKLFIFLLLQQAAGAQPYIDVTALRYSRSPDGGAWRQGYAPNSFHYGSAGINLPIVFKKDSSVLLINPSVERWDINSPALAQLPGKLYGMALPITFVKPFNARWTATVLAIPRWNGADHLGFKDRFQMGGAVLVGHKKSDAFTYQLGLYYNHEAFGHYLMPLLGLNWRLASNLRLFGVLPGSAVLEQKASKKFYYGVSFRAITTSYRYTHAAAPSFIRIDDNTLQAFADVYLSKNIVLNAEGGHSLFRRYRLGLQKENKKYFLKEKFNDNIVFRLSLLYRIRLDGESKS